MAFDITAKRITGEKVSFLDLNNLGGKNPVKRILRKLINRSNYY